MMQHSDHVTLTGPSVYKYTKVSQGGRIYFGRDVFHHAVAMLSIFTQVIITVYPAP